MLKVGFEGTSRSFELQSFTVAVEGSGLKVGFEGTSRNFELQSFRCCVLTVAVEGSGLRLRVSGYDT